MIFTVALLEPGRSIRIWRLSHQPPFAHPVAPHPPPAPAAPRLRAAVLQADALAPRSRVSADQAGKKLGHPPSKVTTDIFVHAAPPRALLPKL